MGLKVKRPIDKTVSILKEHSDDEFDIGDDLDSEEKSMSDEDRNLLSDDSGEEDSELSVHSSDDDLDRGTNDTETKLLENPGWADAMSKILKSNKPKKKRSVVLARAKKLNDIKVFPNEEKLDFEIIKGEGSELLEEPKVKQEPDVKVEKTEKPLSMTVAQKRLMKKAWHLKGRVKPSALDKDREKSLAKIATRGVITLFNTVRQQQKTLEDQLNEAGSLEVKRDKALKSINKKQFLDTLAERAKCENVDNPVKSESDSEDHMETNRDNAVKSKKTWNVLRNNFMMGASMKDWDKEEEQGMRQELKKKTKSNEKETGSKSSHKFTFSMDIDEDSNDKLERDHNDISGDSDNDDFDGESENEDDHTEVDSEDEDMDDTSDFGD